LPQRQWELTRLNCEEQFKPFVYLNRPGLSAPLSPGLGRFSRSRSALISFVGKLWRRQVAAAKEPGSKNNHVQGSLKTARAVAAPPCKLLQNGTTRRFRLPGVLAAS
jgi:hypothetical protein